MARIVIQNAIVCDDIRREMNGKDILIGVYSSDIVLNALPANLRLFFWLIVTVEEIGQLSFNARLLGPSGAQLVEGQLTAEMPVASEASLPIGPLPLQIQSEGKITLQIKWSGGEWEDVKAKNIILQPGAKL